MTTPPPPPPPPAGAPPELEAQPEAQPDPQPEASDESPLRRLHPIDLKFEAKIGRATAMFIVPKNRPSLAYDLAMGTGVNKLFAYAAAIGVFWFGPKPPAAKRPYTNAVLWGQAVADELLELGASLSEIFDLGEALLAHAFTTVPETHKEKEEADFLG